MLAHIHCVIHRNSADVLVGLSPSVAIISTKATVIPSKAAIASVAVTIG